MVPDEGTIVPEESERVEEQPAADEAQSKSTADGNQLTDEDSVNRQSPLLTEEEIDDEPTGLSKLMTPDEQMEKNQEEEKEVKEEEEIEKEKDEGGEEEVKEEEEKEEEKENEGGEGGEGDEEEEEDEDLPTGNENPIQVVNTPKRVEMKVVRGANFPEAKDSDKYYVSVRIEEMRGKICYQTKKFKSKTIRGSQPEWNKNFTIKTQHPESCLMTLKVKKSSLFGLKKSTVGFVKMAVSDLMHDENGHVSALKMQLNDESNNPVGEAYLELDMKVGDLPEVVPSPAELKRQERKLKARQILSDTITQSIHHTGNDKKPQTDKTSNIIKNILKNIFLEEKTTNCLHNPPSDEFIVRGKSVKMLIDSGSPVSFITKEEWKRIGKPPLTQVKGYSFRSTSGRSAKLKGIFMASVVYENMSYLLPLYVSGNFVMNIVGRTWLSAIHNVDWNKKVLSKNIENIQQEKLEQLGQDFPEIPTLNLNINGYTVKAEIDTGTTTSVITKETWDRIGKPKLRKSFIPVMDPTFKKIAYKGRCNVTINKRIYEIIVLKESNKEKDQSNLIGMNVLIDLENIDFNEIFNNLN
jgi:hypothetical protein